MWNEGDNLCEFPKMKTQNKLLYLFTTSIYNHRFERNKGSTTLALERGCFGCMTFFGYEQEQKRISRRMKFIRDEQTNLDKRS